MKRDPELAFLTGAGSGIGRATARRLGRQGVKVVVTDIDAASATATAEQIQADGGRAIAYELDVTDVAAYEELAEEIRAAHGVPDMVVNNAGIGVGGTFLSHSAEDWERVLDVNVLGVVHGCRLFGA